MDDPNPVESVRRFVEQLGFWRFVASILVLVGAYAAFQKKWRLAALLIAVGVGGFFFLSVYPTAVAGPCAALPCIEIRKTGDGATVWVDRGPVDSAILDQVSGVKANSISASRKLAAVLIAAPRGLELRIYAAQPAATKVYQIVLVPPEPTSATLKWVPSGKDTSRFELELTLKTTACEYNIPGWSLVICPSRKANWAHRPPNEYFVVPGTSVSGRFGIIFQSNGDLVDVLNPVPMN